MERGQFRSNRRQAEKVKFSITAFINYKDDKPKQVIHGCSQTGYWVESNKPYKWNAPHLIKTGNP